MKLGISLPVFTADPSRPLGVARRAADLGFDGVFSPDHLFPPFGGAENPSRDKPALECFSLLAAIAAMDLGLDVGTLVTRVTLRSPGMLAKLGAALDTMSSSRAILGLGAGDQLSAIEHETFGIPFPPTAQRLTMLRETSMALSSLFRGAPWAGGEMVPPIAGPLVPPGSPQVWVGGVSDAVLEIAAKTADGWNGWGLDAETFEEKVAALGRGAQGRDVEATWGGIVLVGVDAAEIERLRKERSDRGLTTHGVWSGTATELRSFRDRLADAGATWMIMLPAGSADRLDLIADTLRA